MADEYIGGADMFREIQDAYNETMEEIREEMEYVLSEPPSDCNETDGPEYIESGVAEGHCKTLMAVVNGAMGLMGKCINDSVSAYESEESGKKIKGDFRKGDHLLAGKKYHGLYVGNGKVVIYSKGYDLFPEIKVVTLEYFAKKGTVRVISGNAVYSPDAAVKRALSKLGSGEFSGSEEFVNWCVCN